MRDYAAYCGFCLSSDNAWINADEWFMFVLPAALSCYTFFRLLIQVIKMYRDDSVSDDIKRNLKYVLLPGANFVLILFDTIISIDGVGDSIDGPVGDHIMIALDFFMYLTPMFNWAHFLFLARDGSLFSIKISKMRWLLCLPERRTRRIVSLLDDDSDIQTGSSVISTSNI